MRIGLDIDGVIADFENHFYYYLDIKDTTPATDWNDPRIRENFHKIKDDKFFWIYMPTLVDADSINFEIDCFVTARDISSSITKRWLLNNGFPNVPLYSVGFNNSKVSVLKEKGVDLFLDDALHNYNELNKAGINCILMDAAHNRHEKVEKRIKNINDLIKFYK